MKITHSLAVAAFSFMTYNAQATIVNAGGVQYDSINNYSTGAQGNVKFQQWYSSTPYVIGTDGQKVINSNNAVAAGLGALTGVGVFSDFNVNRTLSNNFWKQTVSNATKSYCTDSTSGCALTFAFGGLVVNSIIGNQVSFNTDNSFLNIYFQAPMSQPLQDLAGSIPLQLNESVTALQQGTLWASLKFNSFVLTGDVLGGTVNSTLDILSGIPSVLSALDTSNIDFKLTGNAVIPDSAFYSENGTGAFQSVPAPTSIGFFGLGLVLLGLVRRRKS
jgi:hypothetical protein